MGLFHKKEKVPEVPLSPNLSGLPELPKEKASELPSLPRGLGQKASNEMVKSAVNDLELPSPTEDGIQELPKDFNFQESVMKPPVLETTPIQQPIIPNIPRQEVKKIETKPFVSTVPNVPMQNTPVTPTSQGSQDPIFVRIDKYQNAKKELQEINKGIKSVEAVLSKLNEIKTKEDKEVGQISESLSSIKTKLTTIDSNVFKKA